MTTGDLFPDLPEPTSDQSKDILRHLRSGRSITALEASMLYGVGRLAAVVFDLRMLGYQIDAPTIKVEKANGKSASVASYRLKSAPRRFGDAS